MDDCVDLVDHFILMTCVTVLVDGLVLPCWTRYRSAGPTGEYETVHIPPGCLLAFRGDVVHAGVDTLPRVHLYFSPVEVNTSPNFRLT